MWKITGFTPFNLTFGREPNKFENFSSISESTTELELEKRSVELKLLFENTHTVAKSKIKKSQAAQKKTQDNRNNVLLENLAPGPQVMIKNDDKIIKKLDARYRGPYTVIAVTDNNNIYVLKDVLGEKLDRSVPLSKLKVVELGESEPFHEIKK